jgi:hyperosmotically inducible protein
MKLHDGFAINNCVVIKEVGMREEKLKYMRSSWMAVLGILLMVSMPVLGMAGQSNSKAELNTTQSQGVLAEKVRHELVMLPWYSLFDNLEFQIEGGHTVVLSGQVVRPVLKSDAENVVKRIEGVTQVVNNIKVLPLSPNDDRIRIAAYRAIYFQPGMWKYRMQAVPPIHIIVDNGHITLVGVVGSQMDKTLAYMAAQRVHGAFSVTDDLQVKNG